MKNYKNFINEEDALKQIKQDIADKIAAEETKKGQGKENLNKMELQDKPNQARLDDITTEIEAYEKQKINVSQRIDEINKKIEIFSNQAKVSSDPAVVAKLNTDIKSLNKSLEELTMEIEKFDKLIADSGKNIENLKQVNK